MGLVVRKELPLQLTPEGAAGDGALSTQARGDLVELPVGFVIMRHWNSGDRGFSPRAQR